MLRDNDAQVTCISTELYVVFCILFVFCSYCCLLGVLNLTIGLLCHVDCNNSSEMLRMTMFILHKIQEDDRRYSFVVAFDIYWKRCAVNVGKFY